ncbi:hypothetical protein DENIS_4866 [Desulfonema ishimotonii]|uniref:Uncharacterized protein n=1 Tax=Desulfonema ishimotonii TaxID=45657 RepID=A0A401G3Q0_9BACT|nr:hypothetical protein [Desulfonema ishimotonii]GBC63867.1 hypothetical protein DENIS_4866 [Desulfonema ishimotonii]
MEIKYEVEEDVDGVLNASKYTIKDSERTLEAWHKLQNDFREKFKEFSSEEPIDYELTDWHNGIKCLSVYIYNEKFYNKHFIPLMLDILEKNSDSFAQFECYDDREELLGYFQIYMNKVYFDEMIEEAGIIDRLCVNRDKNKLTF